MDCLSEDLVLRFVQGGLTDARAAEVDDHVAACADCRQLVAAAAEYCFQPSDQLELERDAHVGRYVVEEPIGAGATSVVYTAHDPQLNRKVALKLLAADGAGTDEVQRGRARLLREARAMARLSHPNVVTIYDAGTYEGQVFVAMELVDGRTLTHWLTDRPRSLREIIDAFVAAGRGLVAAHAAGLVHRDFKPDNVLVGADGRVRVTDFGLARAVALEAHDDAVTRVTARPVPAPDAMDASQLTRTGAVVGTPAYMSPEQIGGGAADARSDQFSFCVALYEALFRERPFKGRDFAELSRSITSGVVAPPSRAPGVPRELVTALLRGLAVAPSERHPSIQALLEVVEQAAAPAPRARRGARLGLAAALVGCGVVIVAALAIANAGPGAQPRRDPAPRPIAREISVERAAAPAPAMHDAPAAHEAEPVTTAEIDAPSVGRQRSAPSASSRVLRAGRRSSTRAHAPRASTHAAPARGASAEGDDLITDPWHQQP